MDKLVMDTETRDLIALAMKRQSEAVYSVLQLAGNKAQAYAIAQAAASAAIGTAAGALTAWQEIDPKSVDPLDVALAVVSTMKAQGHGRN